MERTFTFSNFLIKGEILLLAIFGFSGNLSAQTYCMPTTTEGDIYYITGVTTTGGSTNISNTGTTTSATGYNDYTSMIVTAPAGSSFNLNATGYLFTYKWGVWADWNHDGDFDDADETVYTLLTTDGGLASIDIPIAIPSSASSGNTRLRIVNQRDWLEDPPAACASDLYGEIEDYTITVGSNDCSGTPDGGVTNAASTTLDCGTTTALSLTGNSNNSGITYQWQYNSSGTWVNFGSGAATQTSTPVNQSTQFRCMITCTNSGESAYSTPVTVNSNGVEVHLGNDTSLCGGGSLTLDAGNDPDATYTWNTGATGSTLEVTADGEYIVTASTGTCSFSDTINVSFVALPDIYLGEDKTMCMGDAFTLDAGAIPGATYSWNTGAITQSINVTNPGSYSVTASIGTCTSSDTIVINPGAYPSVSGIVVTGTPPDFTFISGNPQNVYSYSWDFGDGTGTSNLANPLYSYATDNATHTYTVTLIVANDCGTDTAVTTVTVGPGSGQGTGLSNISLSDDELIVYPNPAKQLVTLQNKSKHTIKKIIISNILGQNLLTIPTENKEKQEIDLSSLSSGLYQMIIQFEQGRAVRKLELIK